MKLPVPVETIKKGAQSYLDSLTAEQERERGAAIVVRSGTSESIASALAKVAKRFRSNDFVEEEVAEDWQDIEDINVDGMRVSISSSNGTKNRPCSVTVTVKLEGVEFPQLLSEKVMHEMARVARDVEAMGNTKREELSIGPDDHLYRYLAHPEVTR